MTAPGGLKNTINRSVSNALSLDGAGDAEAAYDAYLSTLETIMGALRQARPALRQTPFPEREPVVVAHRQFIALAKQCMDRVEALYGTSIAQQPYISPAAGAPLPAGSPVGAATGVPVLTAFATTPPGMAAGAAFPAVTADPGPLSPQYLLQEQQELMRPMLMAQRQNERVLKRLRKRGSQHDARALQTMRKCMENVALARKRQEQLRVQLLERRKQRLAMHAEAQQAYKAITGRGVTVVPAGAAAPGTPPSHQALDAQWCEELADGEDSLLLINDHLTRVMAARDHPLGKILAHFVGQFQETFGAIATQGHAPGSVSPVSRHPDIVGALQTFIHGYCGDIMSRYPAIGACSGGTDQVQLTLESVLFPKVLPVVLTSYRQQTAERDALFRLRLIELKDVPPCQYGIKRRFWLTPASADDTNTALVLTTMRAAYASSIACYQALPDAHCPADMLNCFVEVTQTICADVLGFWSAQNEDVDPESIALGAEDLLPLVSFILVQSSPRDVWAYNAFLADFLTEYFVLGSEGYALATIETCIEFLESFDPKPSATPSSATPSSATSSSAASSSAASTSATSTSTTSTDSPTLP